MNRLWIAFARAAGHIKKGGSSPVRPEEFAIGLEGVAQMGEEARAGIRVAQEWAKQKVEPK